MTIDPTAIIVGLLITLLFLLCGCSRLTVDIWDRKKSDICEDWEEKKGSCRDGKGVIVSTVWRIVLSNHDRQNQKCTTLKAPIFLTA